jgi:ribosomal protein S18 acetylase RimI-like enzyme
MSSNAAGCERHSVESGHIPPLSDTEEFLFRRFSADGDDEHQMRELVFNNAFLGRPFDAICPCKQWFSDVVLAPYIKHEPENIHVAIDKASGRLIGYLTGALGGEQFEKLQYDMVRRQVISLAVSLTMPWTLFDQSSRLFVAHVIFTGQKERPVHPHSGVHWHFQVDREFRGKGIGSRLLQRFTADAINADFNLIWAEVSSYPQKPPEYFENRGWSVYDAKSTEIFGDHVDFPVQTLCITKSLSAFQTPTHAI